MRRGARVPDVPQPEVDLNSDQLFLTYYGITSNYSLHWVKLSYPDTYCEICEMNRIHGGAKMGPITSSNREPLAAQVVSTRWVRCLHPSTSTLFSTPYHSQPHPQTIVGSAQWRHDKAFSTQLLYPIRRPWPASSSSEATSRVSLFLHLAAQDTCRLFDDQVLWPQCTTG